MNNQGIRVSDPLPLFRSSLLLLAILVVLAAGVVAQGTPSGRAPGVPVDWTSHHLIFTAPTSGAAAAGNASLAGDPRAIHSALVHGFSLSGQATASGAATKSGNGSKPPKVTTQVDWSVSLGAGNVAPNMYPAKFGASGTVADCTNDYAVFALNVPGTTGGQANLIAFNNLYSGAGSSLCGLTAPTVLFSYNVSTVGGSILTSPITSIFGDRIIFVESTSTAAVLHVLTWHAGEGTSATNSAAPANRCNLDLGPCVCPAGASCDRTLTLNSTIGSTFSSPFPDYFALNDAVYVGTDDGTLYRVGGALYGTPSIVWTSPVSGGVLTGPAILFDITTNDQVELAVYVGDDSGIVYKVDPATGTVAGTTLTVGGGFPNGGLMDTPIVDNSNGTVFAFSADDGTSAVVVQADPALTELRRDQVGKSVANGLTPAVNLHTGMFDNNYFNDPNTGFLYLCGTNDLNTRPVLYRFGFTAGTMNAGNGGTLELTNTAGVECSPLTEIFNSNITAHDDTLFLGLLGGCGTTGCIRDYNLDIPNGAPPPLTLMPTAFLNSVNEAGGTSGIIVDNVDPSPQASSIYFSTLGTSKRAVKLTQSQLK
ncbi:MAG TPA: PQQ-binding-like beta-propeller repeat protein [Terriglobales bacterium]|jgi:hypothetical protein|nr:PQQ-binding-like beta-propeller repeat protein [Terriglobales bacterium]